jgi:hypothetical protein
MGSIVTKPIHPSQICCAIQRKRAPPCHKAAPNNTQRDRIRAKSATVKSTNQRTGQRSRVPGQSRIARPTPQPRSGAITNCLCFIFLSLFFAIFPPKTHVKPQNHLTHYKSTTSTWRMSYPPTAILDIEIKKKKFHAAVPGDYPIDNKYFARNPPAINILPTPPACKPLKPSILRARYPGGRGVPPTD